MKKSGWISLRVNSLLFLELNIYLPVCAIALYLYSFLSEGNLVHPWVVTWITNVIGKISKMEIYGQIFSHAMLTQVFTLLQNIDF